MKIGDGGHAHVLDANGWLIAHPDISLVLRNTDMSGLPQVRAGRAPQAAADQSLAAVDLRGKPVLSADATVAPLNWRVFVELPIGEAYAPLYNSIMRSAVLLLAALPLAVFFGLFLARPMVVPISGPANRAVRVRPGGPGRLCFTPDHYDTRGPGD